MAGVVHVGGGTLATAVCSGGGVALVFPVAGMLYVSAGAFMTGVFSEGHVALVFPMAGMPRVGNGGIVSVTSVRLCVLIVCSVHLARHFSSSLR